MSDFARPYIRKADGATVMLTDQEFASDGGSAYREIAPGEVVNPVDDTPVQAGVRQGAPRGDLRITPIDRRTGKPA